VVVFDGFMTGCFEDLKKKKSWDVRYKLCKSAIFKLVHLSVYYVNGHFCFLSVDMPVALILLTRLCIAFLWGTQALGKLCQSLS
jgi:hypothetical protein